MRNFFEKKKYENYHEYLKDVEKTRRQILVQGEKPHLTVLFKWHGTFFTSVWRDPILWLNLFMLFFLRNYLMTYDNFANKLREAMLDYKNEIQGIGGTLTFFLLFFVVENNERFTITYGNTMAAKGEILAIASLARSKLQRGIALKIVRYLNASYAAGFVGLSDAYTYDGYFLEINKNLMLLSDDDLDRVKECDMNQGGSCYREILQWVQLEFDYLQKNNEIDDTTACVLAEKVVNIQSSISQLYNYSDQPLNFFYIHLLFIVTIIYLPVFNLYACALFAYDKESTNIAVEIIQIAVVFLHHIFITGLRELGKTLSDPFGTDVEDLSVMHYVNFTWRESGRIMQATLPKQKNIHSETKIRSFRKNKIGNAWEHEFPEDKFENKGIECPED